VLTVAITLMVLAVVLTSVLATLLYRNISNGLSHIENTIEQVSRQQDFRLRAKADSQDEIGRTASAFNRCWKACNRPCASWVMVRAR
jgi:methyl-accepting chemotaxis protein